MIAPAWLRRFNLAHLLLLLWIWPLLQIRTIVHLIWHDTALAPFADEWATYFLVIRWHAHDLNLSYLWSYHNEHRIFLPRLINLAQIELTHWDRQEAMTIDLVLMLPVVLLFYLVWRKTFPGLLFTAPFAVLAALFILPPSTENWLSPFQVCFLGVVFGAALATWALGCPRNDIVAMGTAILGGIIGTLCLASGLLIWPAFALVVGVRFPQRRLFWLLWAVLGVGITIAYMRGDSVAQGHYGIDPKTNVQFFLTCLGQPFGARIGLRASQLLGFVGLFVFTLNLALLYRLRPDPKVVAPWLGLCLFSLATVLVTTYGRSYLGLAGAIASRYYSLTLLFWLGLTVLSAMIVSSLWRDSRPQWRLGSMFGYGGYGFASLVLILLSSHTLVVGNAKFFGAYRDVDGCVVEYDSCPSETLKRVTIIPDQWPREAAAYMRANKLGVFAHFVPEGGVSGLDFIPEPPYFNIDLATIQPDGKILVAGWAVDKKNKALAGEVVLLVDRTGEYPVHYGLDRPDVAESVGVAAYDKSGWSALISLPPGVHQLTLRVLTADRKAYYAPGAPFTVTVP